VNTERELHRILAQGLKLAAPVRRDVTRLVCGYMSCDPQRAECCWVAASCSRSVFATTRPGAGWKIPFARGGRGRCFARGGRGRACEALRSVVRGNTPPICCAVAAGEHAVLPARAILMSERHSRAHRSPAQPWTIADLAREAGTSRSVLAERFRHYIGEPRMSYF